jgi:hypothetical protein
MKVVIKDAINVLNSKKCQTSIKTEINVKNALKQCGINII